MVLVGMSGGLPDPAGCLSLDDLVAQLRRLKIWAGGPSYESIKDRVNTLWHKAGRPSTELVGKSTVADCFRTGRQRLNTDLVLTIIEVLHPDTGYLTQWHHRLTTIVDGTATALPVCVQEGLPRDLPEFTGRADELARIRSAARHRQTVVAICGMPGVGKTRLAVRAGQLLTEQQHYDRVFFVNLRGLNPDPAQPPAVLEAFLQLLGVPTHKIPADPAARISEYHDRLAGIRALVVLDNAADAEQIETLTADSPGCLTLITSRRHLTGPPRATHLSLDVFTPQQSAQLLDHAAQNIPVGTDPAALTRIAARCGHLPLALSLVAGHINALPGWTLTDHADRLDKRHHQRRLDTAVELALDLSYQHLSRAEQQLLRLLALHPSHDFDTYAAAALTATTLNTARRHLQRLTHDNLIQTPSTGRYTFHDLVHAHATSRAGDDEPATAQRTALTRLFDHYLAATTTAMNTLYPAETHHRPANLTTHTPVPDLTDPAAALTWLNTERTTLVTISTHTAIHGWPNHTTRLSTVLNRYLAGGHHTDAVTIHTNAHHAAQQTTDLTEQARALTMLGAAYLRLGRHELAAPHLRQALNLFRKTGNHTGQARVLNKLGVIEMWLGRHQPALEYHLLALTLHRQVGERTGEARTLCHLGRVTERLGRPQAAADYHEHALRLFRKTGDCVGEAGQLNDLARIEIRLGHFSTAEDRLQQALTLFQQAGDSVGEAYVLDSLGTLHTRLNQGSHAIAYHRQALAVFRETGTRSGEAWALNGLGEATHAGRHPAEAVTHHTAARTIAADIGDRYQQARAHTGLGHAHRELHNPGAARDHYQQALTIYTDLGLPDADQIQTYLTITLPKVDMAS